MCLEHAPTIRARMGVYITLLCNNVPTPPGHKTWIQALRFPDHRALNRTC